MTMKLTPCLELFFKDLPFPERIARVREAGYEAGEFWSHKGKDLDALAAACEQYGVVITSMVAGGIDSGLNDPARRDEQIEYLERAIAAARVVRCERLIVLSGNSLRGVTRGRQCMTIIEGLRAMAPLAEAAGITLVLEYLNTTHNHPGYFLDNFVEMAGIIRTVNHPNVKALLDIYHAGIMEGNLTEKIVDTLDCIGHFHGAGVPGRHEPKAGEHNYPAICRAIEAAGYDGYLGLEYTPLKDSMESLIETREWING